MADLIAPLPLLSLRAGAEVRFEAIDPATGSPVAGVTLSAAHLWAADVDEEGDPLSPFQVYFQGQGD